MTNKAQTQTQTENSFDIDKVIKNAMKGYDSNVNTVSLKALTEANHKLNVTLLKDELLCNPQKILTKEEILLLSSGSA